MVAIVNLVTIETNAQIDSPMTKQYWIGGFYIDLSRNQITQNQQTQTLAPKALAVLTCLAENQGQVVSQDDLLAQVWPDTIVSPNTLQRSIAQLRRALGDDGKGQAYIKTHAKRGYSLECDVRWHDHTDPSGPNTLDSHGLDDSSSEKANQPQTSRSAYKPMVVAAAILLLGVLGAKFLAPEPSSTITFDTLRSLTATDDKEFDASYSPDGQYIVFHRYLGKLCINKVWAKHIETQQEIQLTKDWGAYGSHDFSPDGQQLVFFATEACDEPVTQTDCFDLVSLDFTEALQNPQQPNVLLQCKKYKTVKPQWIGDDNIALLQRQTKRWRLINYSISNNTSTDLYNPTDGTLIDYAYSAQKDLLAVNRIHSDGQQYIEMLKPDGSLLSSHLIKQPPEIAKFRRIRPNFDPLNDQLIFSTGRQLFTLSYDGQIDKINLPFTDQMIQPVFHPEGNRLLMIKGAYDSDIVLMPLDTLTDDASNQMAATETYTPFERSILGEDYAMFQPDGELIAFWSKRSGEQQLWVSNGQTPRQLTHFPTDTYIRGIDWAKDGQSLLVNANGVLTQVHLDGKQQDFPMPHSVVQLFQWDSENKQALLLVRIRGIIQFVEYDLIQSTFRVITDESIQWALKTADGRLIYKDQLDQFWQPGPAEPQPITALNNQGDRAATFVIRNNTIYAINSNHQLWSYDLDSETFTVLGAVREDVDYLTDVNQTQLLITKQVAAKKEVVELTVSQ